MLIGMILASKRWVLTRDQATKVLTHYPDIPALGCPYGWGNVTWPNLGLQYKRYSSMAGDITMVAPRRMLATLMSKSVENVYSYRWDVPAFNTSTTIGVQHFAEVWSILYYSCNFLCLSMNTNSKLRSHSYLPIQNKVSPH